MFNENEIREWEMEIDKKRFHGWKTEKHYVDPARQRLYKRRRNETIGLQSSYDKEGWYGKYITKRIFRAKMKQRICNEAYYQVRNRDYKTYGWYTW